MKLICVFISFVLTLNCLAANVVVEWKNNPGKVEVTARHGRIESVKGKRRMECRIKECSTSVGPGATVVSVKSDKASFSFFLRDVRSETPIWIPEYEVAVLPEGDNRTYDEVVADIKARKLVSKLERIEQAPESSFEQTLELCRNTSAPIWLGISRDIRRFEVCEELPDALSNLQMDKKISPTMAYSPMVDGKLSTNPIAYNYGFGRGVGPRNNITRSLEDGVMPIYHSELQDDDIRYRSVSFVTLEKSVLREENVPGTHYMISDSYSSGRAFTESQREELQRVFAATPEPEEETVLIIRTSISNSASVPAFAWIKIPYASFGVFTKFDPVSGVSYFDDGRVFCVSRIDGKPVNNQELSVLMQPGQTIEVEYRIPHSPMGRERAEKLFDRPYEDCLAQCKAFWQRKLDSAAQIRVPEQRIQNMLRAGLLHLDLITYGSREQGTLAANVGCYSPIGTESAPIIQYYESLGLLEEARACLQYFIDTQQEDGKIVNFFGYTIETGAALWSIGEYYRYSGDLQWLGSIKPQLLKACRYLVDWRAKSLKDEFKGRGYGMLDGKVADPDDQFHQFMLNAYSYAGLGSICEIFRALGAEETAELEKIAADWKKDIICSLHASMASSPVVPLTDGSWCPTCAPWAEIPSSRFLFENPDTFFSHGTFTTADCLLGPLHLVYAGVLDPRSTEAAMLLKYHRDIFFQGNSAFSQPYYSKHNIIQARLGMVKPFINSYYYTVAPHFDHQTGTFWEHYFKMSVHKTHEEANFLMETRNMLYLEAGDTLKLLSVIPRKWMEDGKEIALEGVRSHFGSIDLHVNSSLSQGFISAGIKCPGDNRPSTVTLRLPHPEGLKPSKVEGGRYDSRNETLTIDNFSGEARVKLVF